MDRPIALAIQILLIVVMLTLQPTLGPFGILFIGCGLGIMASNLRLALITSFIIPFSLWISFAIYQDVQQQFHLGEVIANLFGLPFAWLSYLLTGLCGAIPCTLIALTTFWAKEIFLNQQFEK